MKAIDRVSWILDFDEHNLKKNYWSLHFLMRRVEIKSAGKYFSQISRRLEMSWITVSIVWYVLAEKLKKSIQIKMIFFNVF